MSYIELMWLMLGLDDAAKNIVQAAGLFSYEN